MENNIEQNTQSLTFEIVKYILNNFGIFSDKNSIISNSYKLDKILSFELINDNEVTNVENSLWGCQFTQDKQDFKVLFADLSDKINKELILLVTLTDLPNYLVQFSKDSNIYFNKSNEDWIPCNMFIQATFLAGMEHLKGNQLNWHKLTNYQKEYDLLMKFLDN